jgi:hypothetical protein
MNEEITTTESTETTTTLVEVAPVTAAKPAPLPVRVTRRIYGAHKVYGTCITVGAFVYLAPLAVASAFDKKSNTRLEFLVEGDGAEAIVTEVATGDQWLCAGENGGCGPRLSALPAEFRTEFKSTWMNLSFAERIAIIRTLVTPAAK